uniref:PfkB family carbohydrate kinase n=1 Tax=Nocardia brasiliensis TaxID=37326 RepID=UPI002455D2A1
TPYLRRPPPPPGGWVTFHQTSRPPGGPPPPPRGAAGRGRPPRGSDVVFLGADEAAAVFGTGDPGALRALFPEPAQLIVKNDEHTVTGFAGADRVEVPALGLEVTERIGAGDAFAGGYLAALLHGRPLAQRLRFGHLCAAAALTGTGDGAELPHPSVLERLATLDEKAWAELHYNETVIENVVL